VMVTERIPPSATQIPGKAVRTSCENFMDHDIVKSLDIILQVFPIPFRIHGTGEIKIYLYSRVRLPDIK
jgi:hypothetical protein